jgi:hypothetical protein
MAQRRIIVGIPWLHKFLVHISGKIKFEGDNVLAVKVKNEGKNSRWYSGSGITTCLVDGVSIHICNLGHICNHSK